MQKNVQWNTKHRLIFAEFFLGTAVLAHPNRHASRSELMKFDSFIALTLDNSNNARSYKSSEKL